MRPARKGDGTGLSFPGYSEVRTGDGTVLWSAGADIPDSVVSRPADITSTSTPSSFGLAVNPNSDFSAVGAVISANTANATRARVYDYSQSAYVASTDVSGLTAGDAFSFSISLSAGTDYGIEVDANGGSYTIGVGNEDVSFPVTGEDFDIVGRSQDGTQDTSNYTGINDIGNPNNVLS